MFITARKPSMLPFICYQDHRYTTATEEVIDKTVTHYVLFGIAVKTSKRHHTTCTKMAKTKKSPQRQLFPFQVTPHPHGRLVY